MYFDESFQNGVVGLTFTYLPLFSVPTNNLQPFRVFLRSFWNLAVIFPLLTFYRILVPSSSVISCSRRVDSWPLKMTTPCFFKMLGTTRIMTQDHFPEDLTPQPQSCLSCYKNITLISSNHILKSADLLLLIKGLLTNAVVTANSIITDVYTTMYK